MRCRTALGERIAAFERAAADATDPRVMAAKISANSDRKKYAFADGLQRDLAQTRAALRACILSGEGDSHDRRTRCAFGDLFDRTGGRVANLNRVLQNLRAEGEVDFRPEIFFAGVHDREDIVLLDRFWAGEYAVCSDNVFNFGRGTTVVPQGERKGRCYEAENLATIDIHHCSVCSRRVLPEERIAIRFDVFHLRCISCVVCGSSPSQKAGYMTFDGEICCSAECIRRYDAAHVNQARG